MSSKQKKVTRKNFQKKNEFTVKVMRELYRHVNSKELSLKDREESIDNNSSLTYGEVVPQSFIHILESVCSTQEGCFVDLGCGSGVALLTAALSSTSCHFDRVWGIEILPKLWTAACDVKSRLFDLRTRASLASGNVSQRVVHTPRQPTSVPSTSDSNAIELINETIRILLEDTPRTGSKCLCIEDIAATLCKQFGHRDYKRRLRGHKTFKKLLISRPGVFEIQGNEVLLRDRHSDSDALGNIECADVSLACNGEDTIPVNIDHGMCALTLDNTGEPGGDQDKSLHITYGENLQRGDTGDSVTSATSLPPVVGTLPDHTMSSLNMDGFEAKGEAQGEGGEDAKSTATSVCTSDATILALLQTEGAQDFMADRYVPHVTIERGDIFEIDWWSSADVVYCASLLFSPDMMAQLSERATRMKPQSVFISLKPLREEYNHLHYELVSDSFYKMSWQMARVYIYKVLPRNISSG